MLSKVQRKMQRTPALAQAAHRNSTHDDRRGADGERFPYRPGSGLESNKRPVQLEHTVVLYSCPHIGMHGGNERRIIGRARPQAIAQAGQDDTRRLKVDLAQEEVAVVVPAWIAVCVEPACDGRTLQEHDGDTSGVQRDHGFGRRAVYGSLTRRPRGQSHELAERLAGQATILPSARERILDYPRPVAEHFACGRVPSSNWIADRNRSHAADHTR